MDKGLIYAFILLLFLIAVAYFVGTTQVGLAGAKGAQQFIYAITGRNASGNFASYPQGGGNVPSYSF